MLALAAEQTTAKICGRAMLVMIDGVSLQSSSYQSSIDAIDPFNIERSALSGATSIYGAGATGGVINIITQKAYSDELRLNLCRRYVRLQQQR